MGFSTSGSFLFRRTIIFPASAALVYYRLELLDKDGNFTCSKMLPLKLKGNLFTVTVFPNPTANLLNLKLQETLYIESTLQILDLMGKIVKQLNVSANNLYISLDVQKLSAEQYFNKLNNGRKEINQSFVA